MDFQKYINHTTHDQFEIKQSGDINSGQKPRVIKFIGNMQENIRQLVQGINCRCGNKRQFYNIMIVFANKIEKLRNQRQHYKNTLKQYLLAMSSKGNINLSIQPKFIAQKLKSLSIKQQSRMHSKLDKIIDKENIEPSQKKSLNSVKKQKAKSKSLYTQQNVPRSNYKNKQNYQIKKYFTTLKMPVRENIGLFNEKRTQDKKMKYFYQDNVKEIQHQTPNGQVSFNPNDQVSFSPNDQVSFTLDLSQFQDGQKQKAQFMRQVSSIMNQTNLLESDQEEGIVNQEQNQKKQVQGSGMQQKIDRLKTLKQSRTFSSIFQSKRKDQAGQTINNCSRQSISKRKQNPEQGQNIRKPIKRGSQKQNTKAESCLKKYNITLEKLEQFIQNKESLRQIHFKTINNSWGQSFQLTPAKNNPKPLMGALQDRNMNYKF